MRLAATLSSELLGPEGAAQFAWSPAGDLLAVAAARRKKVVLFDPAGGVVASLTVPDPAAEFLYDEAAEPPVATLAWHPGGGHLAVLPRGQSFAMVWSPGGGTARVDSGVRQDEVTALAWGPSPHPQLALGTAKGGGLIYDLTSRAATPLALGRAGKPVCCLAWSGGAAPGGLLALGCKGGLLLLCRASDGGLARSVQLKGAVGQLQFCEAAARGGGGGSGRSSPDDRPLAGQAHCPAPAAPAGALLAATVGRRSVCVWQLPQALAGDAASAGGPAAGSAGGAFELAFREGYGEVEAFCWVHPRLLAAGFSSGQLVAVSLAGGAAPGSAAGTELLSSRLLPCAAAALAWCPASGALAAGGGAQLALLACRAGGGGDGAPEVELQEQGLGLELEAGARLAGLQFSPDGKFLTAASSGGRLLQLLARPPHLHGAWGGRAAYVDPSSSPCEALLLDTQRAAAPVALPLPAAPALLALGPAHLAAAEGDTAWYQAVEPDPATSLLPRPVEARYPCDIAWLRLGPHCALLLGEGGRVFVHAAPAEGGPVVELGGEDGEPFAAGAAALTEHFIVLGLPDGTLAFYDAGTQALASEFHHAGGAITALFANADGTLVLFQDAAGGAFLYDAASGTLMAPPQFQGELAAAVWDGTDGNVVAAVNAAGVVHVYCLVPASVEGPGVKLVGTQAAPRQGAAPLTLLGGLLTWHLPEGPLHAQLLDTHRHLAETAAPALARSGSSRGRSGSGRWQQQLAAAAAAAAGSGAGMSREERLAARCEQALALCHFGQALAAAQQLGDPGMLKEVALAALQFMELPTAVAAYEAAGDEAALAQLRPLLGERDEGLVTGQLVAMTGGDADRAEALLLACSRPSAAIDMRRGLGQWERALQLAEHLEPHALGGLALLRAQALEAEGQVEAALAAYRQALAAPDLTLSSGVEGAAERRAQASAGLARCAILGGEVEEGMELALGGGGGPELLGQCAGLLESQGLAKQAGQLYAHAGQYERAAALFLSCREFGLLDGVMPAAGSAQLWLQYAQAKEDLGSYADAARAYEQAGDAPAAAHVLLERLRDPQAAAELAARCSSPEAALAVARHCEQRGGAALAQLGVEQYCLSGNRAAAFALAKRAGLVPAFAAWARRARDGDAALLAAEHFEAQGQLAEAAELCALAGKAERAARLYLQAGADSLPAAVKLAGEAGDPAAAAVVLEHLQAVDAMGPALLQLHLALGNAEQACAVALARAQQEQAAGNYKAARDQLLSTCLELQRRGAPATPGLLAALHTVHAYLLVRLLVRQGDHQAAARLLLAVAQRIAAFPKHAAAILTSCVIECHRAGLHGPAQRWAAELQQPQYAGQVSAAYSKKIEAIAKQPAWTAEAAAAAEPQCDCLFCGAAGPEAGLTCASCQRALPFCAASGRRMVLSDWSACPSCNFPCRGRDLTRFASVERCCPLCEAPLAVHDVKRIFDALSHLRKTVFAGLAASSRKG